MSDAIQIPLKSVAPDAPPATAPAAVPAERPLRARPAAITVTPAAAERVRDLLAKRGKPSVGVRIGVRTRGCSGLSYTLEYADARGPADEAVEIEGATILIDPKASMFVFGTEMDYADDNIQAGFVFKNPNEKGRCGCGESFHV